MNPEQRAFLHLIAEKIPRLFKSIAEGNVRAEYILGQRTIRGRQVRLKLIAEVVDPGANPLSTHSKPPLMAGSNQKQKCTQKLRFEMTRREPLHCEKAHCEKTPVEVPFIPLPSIPFDSGREHQPASETEPSNQPG